MCHPATRSLENLEVTKSRMGFQASVSAKSQFFEAMAQTSSPKSPAGFEAQTSAQIKFEQGGWDGEGAGG
jgi:hypothetical protein